jgi:hypothetical protein
LGAYKSWKKVQKFLTEKFGKSTGQNFTEPDLASLRTHATPLLYAFAELHHMLAC